MINIVLCLLYYRTFGFLLFGSHSIKGDWQSIRKYTQFFLICHYIHFMFYQPFVQNSTRILKFVDSETILLAPNEIIHTRNDYEITDV